MNSTERKICPCCGQPIVDSTLESRATRTPDRHAEEASAKAIAEKTDGAARQAADVPEYDRRGIRLPRRTRMGGIIVPQ